jgi:kynurenine formamidase/predicted dehydrogenase
MSTLPTATAPRRGLLIGAGYFSQFHLDAWNRTPGTKITCICDLDLEKANRAAQPYAIPGTCRDVDQALDQGEFDFVDIATPPGNRWELVAKVVARGLPLICQKPLANDFETARHVVDLMESSKAPCMVHENFRFQPWYREIKRLIDQGRLGSRLHSIRMVTRLGDGWGTDAYLNRQPYFRTMPRFLIHETGVHFVDVFRYLAGEIVECHARLRRWNDVIQGEDAGVLMFQFANGANAIWDANRYNESLASDPRFTFGELLVEGNGGSLWLDSAGKITLKPLGQSAQTHDYLVVRSGFGGDCVHRCFQHFLDVLDGKVACETSGAEYLKTLAVVEALYESNLLNRPIRLGPPGRSHGKVAAGRRVVDLSLPITNAMRGVSITTSKTIAADGWNATTLSLYSHAGTHMDAPKHFIEGGDALDLQDLSACCGPARVVHVPNIQPRQAICVQDVVQAIGQVSPGQRLLFRTDWYRRYGTREYRDELPRISLELAHWLVHHQVGLIGVEPPSVADVNNLRELTDVHRTLFRGGVVIVEGLANLDQLRRPWCDFLALPLKIVGGDGCPVRAIAIEDDMGGSGNIDR